MAEIASAFVSILPSAKGFGSKLQSEVGGDLNTAGKGIGSKFGTALKLGAGAALGGAVVLGGFLKGAVGEAREAQKVGALTNAVIKSTGGVANVTAKDVDRLATSISLKTGVDDEAIAAGQNMLLTFGNVRNEVGKGNDIFSQATVAATDMAAAFGGDAVSNSKMLGKALNDPTKGVSALTRVGVSFTEQQKEQISTLQASGDTLGAQKIILGELSKQTAGAAESQATAGDKFKTSFGNLQESIGTLLLPVLDKALTGLTKFVIFLTNDIGPGIAAINGYLAPAIASVKTFFGALFAGGGAVSGIGAIFQTRLLPVLATAANTFRTVVLPAIQSLVTYVTGRLVPVFAQVAGIITGRVLPILSSLAQFFYAKVVPAIFAVATSVASKLKPVFDQLVATFRGKVLPTVVLLLNKFREWQPTIQKVVLVVVKIIGKVLEFAAAILGKVLPPVIRFAGFLLTRLVPAVIATVETVAKIIGKVIAFGGALVDAVQDAAKFLSGVKEKIGAALRFIEGIPGKIKAAFSGAGTLLSSIGGQIVDGLVAGIRAAAGKVMDAVNAVVDKIPKFIREKMGIASPSKVTTVLGGHIADGLAVGINAKAPAVAKAAADAVAKAANAAKAAAEKARKALAEKWGGIVTDFRDSFQTLKSDMKSLRDSVAGAFNADMFGVVGQAAGEIDGVLTPATTALQEFMGGLTGNNSNLTAMLAAFDQLKAAGASTGFLNGLFQSGNTALATQLATAGPDAVKQASALFDQNASLANQLGQQVAINEFGPEASADIKALRKAAEDAPKKYAAELKAIISALEAATERGAEKGTRAGNDDRNKDTKQRERAGR